MAIYRNVRKRIKNPYTSEISFASELIDGYPIKKVKYKGICLKQDSVSFIHGNIVNSYISYELDTWSRGLKTDFTLGNCFFGVVKLTKNNDCDKYGYSGFWYWV